jgi:IclR family KDG regulon transcriptional repressor
LELLMAIKMTEANPNSSQPKRKISKQTDKEPPVSSTIGKAMQMVEILASHADSGMSLSELADVLDQPLSSTHRYLASLQSLGLAHRTAENRFTLGTKILALAGIYLARSDVLSEARPVLKEMSELTGETIHLAVPADTAVVYIAKIDSKHMLNMSSYIGYRSPMFCTSLGKAILAYSDEKLMHDVLSEVLKAPTSKTVTDPATIKREMVLIRQRGYAIDDEENEVGIRCVGSAIRDFTGQAIAAISVSGPSDRLTLDRVSEIGELLKNKAREISLRRGLSG